MVPLRRRLLATSGAVLALAAAGCSRSATEASVEEQLRSQLGVESVDCPGDLDGTVGATLTCTATEATGTVEVLVTVTSIQGDDINFRYEAVQRAGEPDPEGSTAGATGVVDGPSVAQNVFDQLAATVGQEPDQVQCPDLPAQVGAAIRCELTAGGETYGVTVTTTAVQGDDVSFDIEVDQTPS